MSTPEIVGAGVLIAVALIAAFSLKLSDGRKRKEENRKKGIETFGDGRTAWDQAQVEEITLSVRKEKLREAGRELVQIKLFVGKEIQTKDFEELVALLGTDLLAPGNDEQFAAARALWQIVEQQLHKTLEP